MSIDDPTTADTAEADLAIRTYVAMAHHVADGNGDAASAVVANFLDDDATASERIWGLTFLGPTIIAAASKRLNADASGDLWVLHTDGDIDDMPPTERAAARSVVRALNDEADTAHELITAHYRATADRHGHAAADDALIHILHAHAHMLAELINAGALRKDVRT